MKKIYSLLALVLTSCAFAQNYELVTSASQIVDGGQYIIVGVQSNNLRLLNSQTTNNRSGEITTISASTLPTVLTPEQLDDYSFAELTLSSSVSGTWNIKEGANYLYAAGTGNNNHLRTSDVSTGVTFDDLTQDREKWNITFDGTNISVISATTATDRKSLRYNSSSSSGNLFSCYASGQSQIYFYKLAQSAQAPTAVITDNLTDFSYVVGSGPSLIQDLTITLENLTSTDNVTIEFGDDFYELVDFEDVVFENGTNVIQIQLKDELTVGIYNTTLNVLINGVVKDTIELVGEVNAIPVSAEFTEEGLELFSYEFGAEESETQTIVLTVENLLPNQSLTLSSENSNFEIINPSTIVNGTNEIVIRLALDLEVGNYDGAITVSLDDTLLDTIALQGEVTEVLSNTQNEIEGLNVFPNPSNDIVTIASNSSALKTVQLFDILGKKVLEVETENTINVSTINKGIYTLRVTQEGKVSTSKLVVK